MQAIFETLFDIVYLVSVITLGVWMLRSSNPLGLTQKFRDFKRAGVQGIETCKIQSIILPLLADHVLREANHYLRMLEAGK